MVSSCCLQAPRCWTCWPTRCGNTSTPPLLVVVYTDTIGSNDNNLQQSQARAVVVSIIWRLRGVAEARLTARGAGESAPLEAPNTPEGRDLNRRLQVMITALSS